jgi:choline dehydrogenase-like flavoprotein
MTESFDAIVVGARCGGAPTAMLLARKGYRVLLVDRATFPSDTVSTHFIHAPGKGRLRSRPFSGAARRTTASISVTTSACVGTDRADERRWR